MPYQTSKERNAIVRAIIFANGVMKKWPEGFERSTQGDLIIAADGGLNHCKAWNIKPHVIVGDMDSVDPLMLTAYENQGAEIIRYPSQKNKTDLELAVQAAADRDVQEVVILGALGERWDMTMANLLILTAPLFIDMNVRVLDNGLEVICLLGHTIRMLEGQPGNTMSLLPIAGPAVGVTLKGFEYPLVKKTLPMGTTRGISNIFKREITEIEIESGVLLVVIDRK